MGRPTLNLRLATLDVETASREVIAAYEAHLYQLAGWLNDGLRQQVEKGIDDHGIGPAVALLAQYARQGKTPDLPAEVELLQTARELIRTLYGSTINLEPDEVDLWRFEPRASYDPVALVLVAAWARRNLALRQPLSVGQVAALGSCSPTLVRKELQAGRLTIASRGATSTITPESAARWLYAHDVPGVPAPGTVAAKPRKAPRQKKP